MLLGIPGDLESSRARCPGARIGNTCPVCNVELNIIFGALIALLARRKLLHASDLLDGVMRISLTRAFHLLTCFSYLILKDGKVFAAPQNRIVVAIVAPALPLTKKGSRRQFEKGHSSARTSVVIPVYV